MTNNLNLKVVHVDLRQQTKTALQCTTTIYNTIPTDTIPIFLQSRIILLSYNMIDYYSWIPYIAY